MNLNGIKLWIGAHKGVVAAGGGVVGLAVIMRARSKNAGTATTSTTATTTTPATVANPATADTSAYDSYNALNDQLTSWESSVQAQIDGLTTGGNAAPTPDGTSPAPSTPSTSTSTPTPTPAAPAPTTSTPVPTTSTYVASGNQFVNGIYVGPAGVPYYSQSQLNAMTAAQRSKVTSGAYTLVPDSLAAQVAAPTTAPATPTTAAQRDASFFPSNPIRTSVTRSALTAATLAK